MQYCSAFSPIAWSKRGVTYVYGCGRVRVYTDPQAISANSKLRIAYVARDLVVAMRFPGFIATLFASTTLFIAVFGEAICYYPDGKNATGLSPCNNNAAVSHCCRDADVCLSNGVCFSPGLGSIVRRGCTDPTWNSTECPNTCNIGVYA